MTASCEHMFGHVSTGSVLYLMFVLASGSILDLVQNTVLVRISSALYELPNDQI